MASQQSSKNIETDDEGMERRHFNRIVNALRYYKVHSLKRVLRSEKDYKDLPPHHKLMLPEMKFNFERLRGCIEVNSIFIQTIIDHTDHMFENKDIGHESQGVHAASEFDMDKVKTTLRQFVRDWSSEGQEERNSCYGPILKTIQEIYPLDKYKQNEVSILVPGAGMGRLAFEIARLGHRCQGNEFSLFMLFASNFVLNRCREVDSITLYPWIHQHSNNYAFSDIIRPVNIPDVNPCDLPVEAEFSMAAGDFLEVYTEPESWDCVTTVYFIDTAHNIISYIENIYNILKPGGYWINFGPLLYHFADMASEHSIELTYQEVREVIKKCNFELVREDLEVPSTYTSNKRSMICYQYRCVFFVARKPDNRMENFNSPPPHNS